MVATAFRLYTYRIYNWIYMEYMEIWYNDAPSASKISTILITQLKLTEEMTSLVRMLDWK